MTDAIHDLIIIGTGAAGYTASIYASRYKVAHVIIGSLPGGVITESHLVENFPTEEGISGMELGLKIQKHAKNLGVNELFGEVKDITKDNDIFKLKLANGDILTTKTVLLATGTISRRLGLEHETEFVGKGVAYCATCDGFFYRNKTVAVVGGSDSATTASIYLSDLAEKVYLIVRGENLKGETAWIEKVSAKDNVKILYNTNVVELIGENKLEKIKLDSSEYLDIDGLFIEIGADPATQLAEKLGAELNERKYVKVNADQSTTVKGLFAAGDLTTNSNGFKQVITACGEGAVAASSIFNYLKKN